MEDLQDKLLLLGAADAQQVGSMSLAEQVCLQPAELLIQLGRMKYLHTRDGDRQAGVSDGASG